MDYSVFLGLLTSGAGALFGPRKRGARDAWQSAAETYGLLHKPSGFWSGPKLSGSLSGNRLTVDMKNRNTASAETHFRLAMPSQRLGLRLRKKGFWNSFRPRILTGDRAFDRQVVVEGRSDFDVQEYLTPERRAALQNFLTSFKGAVVTDDEISFKTRGYVKKSDEMLGAIDALMQVAGVLTEDADATAVGQSAAVTAATAAVIGAVGAVAAEPASEPAPEFEPGPEFESDSVPEPEPVSEPQPVVEATASSDLLSAQDNTPGVEEFCATIFAPGTLSFTANQKFKESYAGERVVWTGTLESVTPFGFDFDFGPGRGTRAVLTITESEADGSRKVQAVIGLPPGIEGLDDRMGQRVAFTGRLLKVDGLAKRVVIADAEIRP